MRFRFRPRTIALAALALATFAADAGAQSFEQQVVELVNLERWDHGRLPPLKHEPLLDASSEAHSQAMSQRNFVAHCDLDTRSSFTSRMSAAGYAWSSAAENIAWGYSTPAAVVAGWMGSTGHRANILGNRRELGVGHAHDAQDAAGVRLDQNGDCNADGTSGAWFHYWTQNFGTRGGVDPVVIDREAYSTEGCDVGVYVYNSIGANQMRFSNDGVSWSAWVPYAADASWRLAGASGAAANVQVEIRAGGNVRRASDTIVLATSCAAAGGGETPMFAHGFE